MTIIKLTTILQKEFIGGNLIKRKKKKWQKYFNTKSIVLMALFAALLCVSAYISISLPIPGAPHLTLVNFMVLLISFVLPAFQPALVVAVWMLLGIVGVPVFIGGATGIGYLIGPWGGYTLSFIVVAILAPIVRGKNTTELNLQSFP